jgi:hypothetical protein
MAFKLRKMAHSGSVIHNCYCGFGGIWQVKLYVGGEQRIVGETFDCLRAVRFADMALVFFAKYRKRRARPMLDSDLNFSVATANRDLSSVPKAAQILVSLETELLAKGLIGESVKPYEDNRTAAQVCRDLRVFFHQYKQSVLRAQAVVGPRGNPSSDVAFEMARASLETLDKLNESFDRYLSETNTASGTSNALRASVESTTSK